MKDGDSLGLGRHDRLLRALRTPGHTGESTCYLLADTIVFTGDTLFLRGVGRPDLGAGTGEVVSRARSLHGSLSRLRALPGGTLVLPAHTSEPTLFDGAPHTAALAQVVAESSILSLDPEAFVALLTSGGRAAPRNHAQIIQYNETGLASREDPTDLESGANRCSVG